MTEPFSRADEGVVAAWIEGWALSRGVGPPVPAYGGLRVDVGLPDQKARYVFAQASPGVHEASCAIEEPHVFLKVCASPERVGPLLHRGWDIRAVGFMMTTGALEPVEVDRPAGYRFDHCAIAAGCLVNILTGEADVAASGRVILVGRASVFDRIETHPAHRRRGLGRIVMNELGRLAREAGASSGILVATADGRALYSALGWRLHTLYTTAGWG